MSVQWMAFYLITLATAVLLVRLFFLYSQYVELSHLPRKTEAVPVPVSTEQDSAKNEAEKALSKTKKKPVKKSAKKKPAKKSKKKKG